MINTKMSAETITSIQDEPLSKAKAPRQGVNAVTELGSSQIVPVRGDHNFGRWLEKEKILFEKLFEMFGPDWNRIASAIQTRTPEQVRSHAQKVLNKRDKIEEKKRDFEFGLKEFESAPNITSTRSRRRIREGQDRGEFANPNPRQDKDSRNKKKAMKLDKVKTLTKIEQEESAQMQSMDILEEKQEKMREQESQIQRFYIPEPNISPSQLSLEGKSWFSTRFIDLGMEIRNTDTKNFFNLVCMCSFSQIGQANVKNGQIPPNRPRIEQQAVIRSFQQVTQINNIY